MAWGGWLEGRLCVERGPDHGGGREDDKKSPDAFSLASNRPSPLPRVWKRINALFNWLPLAALIENKILCMHGGIGRCINQVRRALWGKWLRA